MTYLSEVLQFFTTNYNVRENRSFIPYFIPYFEQEGLISVLLLFEQSFNELVLINKYSSKKYLDYKFIYCSCHENLKSRKGDPHFYIGRCTFHSIVEFYTFSTIQFYLWNIPEFEFANPKRYRSVQKKAITE